MRYIVMDKSKRQRRRNDLDRMKKRAIKLYEHPKSIKLANHLAVCSGVCCGNARKYDGPTKQERLKDDLMEQ